MLTQIIPFLPPTQANRRFIVTIGVQFYEKQTEGDQDKKMVLIDFQMIILYLDVSADSFFLAYFQNFAQCFRVGIIIPDSSWSQRHHQNCFSGAALVRV